MKEMNLLCLIMILFTNIFAYEELIELYENESPPYDNGQKAELHIFLPDENPTGRAIVICPGGGYIGLSKENEGTNWAPFFNKQGISIFILYYRLPGGDRRIPINDAEEAIRLVRKNADKWKIDPQNVGIMGFSAGGHLASTIATHSIDDAKPNFQILFYPVITMEDSYTHQGSKKNFLGDNPIQRLIDEFSNEKKVTNDTPRAFIILSNDDKTVPPLNGVNYYLACNENKVSSTLHIFPTGGHGWGSKESFEYHELALNELKSWLNSF